VQLLDLFELAKVNIMSDQMTQDERPPENSLHRYVKPLVEKCDTRVGLDTYVALILEKRRKHALVRYKR
jgi:hypothetical protein